MLNRSEDAERVLPNVEELRPGDQENCGWHRANVAKRRPESATQVRCNQFDPKNEWKRGAQESGLVAFGCTFGGRFIGRTRILRVFPDRSPARRRGGATIASLARPEIDDR